MSEFQTKLHSVPSGGFLTDRDKDKKPILDVRELGIDFGGLTAVDGQHLMSILCDEYHDFPLG